MDLYEQPAAGRPLPRRELQLQGPRPAPLKVRKDSYKIKKAPAVSEGPPPQKRSPVIIYTVSPKVIHTKPSEFMSLVQRLTGVSASAADNPAAGAKFASVEIRRCTKDHKQGADREEKAERGGLSPRILSLLPPSSTPISTSVFSPSAEMISPVNFMSELSPGLQGGKAFMESNFLNSPGNLLSTPAISSPINYWDLFNQYKEL